LQRIARELTSRNIGAMTRARADRNELDAIHAAELQLPDAWLPFVVSR
jgi:hypothetical protein